MTVAPARRTQRERSEAMQERLIAATIDCLVEKGYVGTSTLEVQQRAGVSRGALLHHFPSRNELIFAALSELTRGRTDQLRQGVQEMTDTLTGAERIDRAIELLWATFDGSLFQASQELWNAARTDPELRAPLVAHERRIGQEIALLCRDVFGPEAAAHPSFEAVCNLVIQAMRGEAASSILRKSGSRRDDELVGMLQQVARTMLSSEL